MTWFATVPHPARPNGWDIRWGAQLDIRTVRTPASGQPANIAVAAYLAKYATKSTEAVGTEDKMANHLAEEVLRASTDFDGAERAPMRNTEARITLGVIAARQGDIQQAVHYGERALTESRRSLPSLAMVSRDLARVLKERYPAEQATENYLDQLRTAVGNLARTRRL